MNTRGKEFVVSVAEFAFYVDDTLACTGTTNLSSSLSVSMEEQSINAGKGNQKVFSYKYGRELTAELEAADWKLEYIAMQTGSQIMTGLRDVYHLNECVTLVNGIGTIKDIPVGKIGVELPNGTFVEVDTEGSTTLDLTAYDLGNVKVRVTYQYSAQTKRITIDADTAPYVGRLVLQADKHNNKKGKVGTVEIVIPSYSLNGNFDISFSPDGVTSTSMAGTALAVDGDTCEDGSAVYAYINEIDDEDFEISVSEIAISAPAKTVVMGATLKLSTVGLMSKMYAPIELEGVTYASGTVAVATVGASTGVITPVKAGTTKITATYGDFTDEIDINVVSA